jgi:flagellar motor switch protein FliG
MPASQSKKLTPTQRAASIIITLGADRASKIYQYLKDEEIEQLSIEIAKLDRITPEEMQNNIEDFYGLCVTQKVINEGGVLYAKDILEKAFGSQQASSYMERVAKSLQTRAFDFVRKADYRSLQMMLQPEHPQTIALVLSYARSEQAAQVIVELPREKQIDVVERIANLDSVSPEMIAIVEETLGKRFANIASAEQVEVGGVTYVADIVNRVDRATEKYIFERLDERNPALSEEIHKLMFVFEDVIKLDDFAIQRFIREVDTKDLAVALKATTEEVKESIFRNMSARMRETIQQDIQYLNNIRMRDVEEAQQKIVEIITRLEAEGQLVIARGEEDAIV